LLDSVQLHDNMYIPSIVNRS